MCTAPTGGFRHVAETFSLLTRAPLGSASVEVTLPETPNDLGVSSVSAAPAGTTVRPSVVLPSVPPVDVRAQRASFSGTFARGWYDSLESPGTMKDYRREGTDSALPYYSPRGNVQKYLDAARAAGVTVYLEIPRSYVKNRDRASINQFVLKYRSAPALAGWYLADEPTYNKDIGKPSPAELERLYNTIKVHDPNHPVAIDFSTGENAAAYSRAMDIMMFDDYPCLKTNNEYGGLYAWTAQLARAARTGTTKGGFVPVIQAFQQRAKMPWVKHGFRLPSANEERYMVFTAIQFRATGVFFWVHYRSDPAWIGKVLMPITSEVTVMRRALAAGVIAGEATSTERHVFATAHRDPVTNETYVVVVNRSSASRTAEIILSGDLARATSATPTFPPSSRRSVSGRISVSLDQYGVQVFRLPAV